MTSRRAAPEAASGPVGANTHGGLVVGPGITAREKHGVKSHSKGLDNQAAARPWSCRPPKRRGNVGRRNPPALRTCIFTTPFAQAINLSKHPTPSSRPAGRRADKQQRPPTPGRPWPRTRGNDNGHDNRMRTRQRRSQPHRSNDAHQVPVETKPRRPAPHGAGQPTPPRHASRAAAFRRRVACPPPPARRGGPR